MPPLKLFNLPDASLRVRKIKVIGKNMLKIEAIKFNYSLITQTTKKQREIYTANYNLSTNRWIITKK
jgi:type VI protein secretion system component Hcp